jgi:hypothetical protein
MELKRTVGYVGSIEVETAGHDRIWFSLTERDTGSDWVEIDGRRAWFQMSLEPSNARPVELAKLALVFEAMRERQQIAVYHPEGPHAGISRMTPNDTWDAKKVRSLRPGIHF